MQNKVYNLVPVLGRIILYTNFIIISQNISKIRNWGHMKESHYTKSLRKQ